jgi:hypothetical protein
MTSPELECLADIGQLKREPGAQTEIDGLDSIRKEPAHRRIKSRVGFGEPAHLAYNAAYAFAVLTITTQPCLKSWAPLPLRW